MIYVIKAFWLDDYQKSETRNQKSEICQLDKHDI